MSIVSILRRDPNPHTRSLYDAANVERRLSYAEHQSEVIKCQAQLVTAQTDLARAESKLIDARERMAKFLADDLTNLGIPIAQINLADGLRRAAISTDGEGTPTSELKS